MRKNKEKPKKEKGKEKKAKDFKTNMDVLDIIYYDMEAGAYVLRDGSYMNLFEICSKDKENLLDDEVQFDMLTFAKLYKIYSQDLKIIALNFPVNTQGQRNFLMRKIEKTNSPIKKKWLMRSVRELELQDQNKTKREYYLFYWGEDAETFHKNTRRIESNLDVSVNGSLREVPLQKKHQIMHKLNNMSSLVIIEEGEKDGEE